MSNKTKKLEQKVKNLKWRLKTLEEDAEEIYKKKRFKKHFQEKLLKITITIFWLAFSAAAFYSVFLK